MNFIDHPNQIVTQNDAKSYLKNLTAGVMANNLRTSIVHGEEIGEKEDGPKMKDRSKTQNYIEKHY